MLFKKFISDVKEEHERKLVLEVLRGKNYIKLAEEYEEYTMDEIEKIFRKRVVQALRKNGIDEGEEFTLEDLKKLV